MEELQTQDSNTQAADSSAEAQNTQRQDSQLDQLFKPEQSAQQLAELDKFEKFKFDGKEWTPSDLKKSIMLQSEFTKKSQEFSNKTKEYETKLKDYDSEVKHREFRANLKADIDHVKNNPALVEQFKKIYPEEYHWLIDGLKPEQAQNTQPKVELPPEIMEKLSKHDEVISEFQKKAMETERQAMDARLDADEAKYTQKYPYSKPALGMVYGALETFAVKNNIKDFREIPDNVVEGIYKNAHEQMVKMAEQINNEKVKQQLSANKEGQDVGRGGATATEAPPKIRLKDVADHVISGL